MGQHTTNLGPGRHHPTRHRMKTFTSDDPADFSLLQLCVVAAVVFVYGICALVKDFFTGANTRR